MPTANDETRSSGASPRHLDRLFDLLAANRRRLALYYLSARDVDTVEFDDVVSFVTERAPGSGEDEIAIDLRHDHLPRMERAGVVEYDERSGTIRYRGDELLEAWVDRAAEREEVLR